MISTWKGYCVGLVRCRCRLPRGGLGECEGSVRRLLDKRNEALTFSSSSTKTNAWRVGEMELRLDPAEKRLDAWHGSEKGW